MKQATKTMNRQNDPQAEHPFTKLLEEHQAKIYRIIELMVGNPDMAEDVAQETIRIALQKFEQLHDEERFIPWTLKIAERVRNRMFQARGKERKKLQAFYENQKDRAIQRAENQNPEKRIIEKDEVRAVLEKLATLPEDQRVAYGLYCVDGFQVEAIAKMLGISNSAVKKRLAKARKRFTGDSEYLAIALLTSQLTSADHQAFLAKIKHLVTESAQFSDVLAATASEATSTGVAVSGSLAVRILWALFSLPILLLLWVVSLLISGQACGMAFIRNAPSVQARRWLVKQLFVCYCGLVCGPVLLLITNHFLTYVLGWGQRNVIETFTLTAAGISTLAYLIWMNRKHRRISANPDLIRISNEYLQRFLYRGYAVLSFVISGIAFASLWFIIPKCHKYLTSPHSDSTELIIVIAALACLILFHVNVYFCFRYFLGLSQDEPDSFREVEFVSQRKHSWKYELVCVLPFALFTLVPHVVHLLTIRLYVILPSALIVLFSICWVFVLRQNIKSPKYRWRSILTTFVFQLLVVIMLRLVI